MTHLLLPLVGGRGVPEPYATQLLLLAKRASGIIEPVAERLRTGALKRADEEQARQAKLTTDAGKELVALYREPAAKLALDHSHALRAVAARVNALEASNGATQLRIAPNGDGIEIAMLDVDGFDSRAAAAMIGPLMSFFVGLDAEQLARTMREAFAVDGDPLERYAFDRAPLSMRRQLERRSGASISKLRMDWRRAMNPEGAGLIDALAVAGPSLHGDAFGGITALETTTSTTLNSIRASMTEAMIPLRPLVESHA